MNDEFRSRLQKVFNYASMAEVARQLKIPHATVRNYFKEGRLPATEVLMKIADETGVSLNWLLLGQGEMYAGQLRRIGLGRFLEEKILEIIDSRFADLGYETPVRTIPMEVLDEFDVAAALQKYDDPQKVMSDWLHYENREFPKDFGVVFFRGWESFSDEEKIDALVDAKKVLDRELADRLTVVGQGRSEHFVCDILLRQRHNSQFHMQFISDKMARLRFGWNERPLAETDFYRLCRRFKITVVEMPLRTNGFYYRVLGRDYIAIDSRLTGAKKLLVQFHELAHFLLHTPESGATANFHGVGRKTRQEREADAVALCALVPRQSLEDLNSLSEDDLFPPDLLAARSEILERYGI